MSHVICQVLESLTGVACNLKNMIECEFDARKRVWLKSFSKPKVLTKDVSNLCNDADYDWMTEDEQPIPKDIACWSFGFSCKDLSTLNNHSKSYKDDCLATKSGSTGITWHGNLNYAKQCMPYFLQMRTCRSAEKVRTTPSSSKTWTRATIVCSMLS